MKNITTKLSKIFLILGIFYINSLAIADVNLPTYFNYTPSELNSLKKLSSHSIMTDAQLRKWDQIMFNLVKENKLPGTPAAWIYAYVYSAQRDAAYISKNIKHQYVGSLDPVTSKVLCLFFVKDCPALRNEVHSDAYSDTLADIVVSKIRNRIALDKQAKRYPQILKGKNYWAGETPFIGQNTGSLKPWIIASPAEFLPPPPPEPQSKVWQQQLAKVKAAVAGVTPEQRNSIVMLAGNPGSTTTSGLWLSWANGYMEDQGVPFTKRLLVRSVLADGIADAFIAVFHAKYTYWVRRPMMLDPSLVTVIPTPNHPSYPAGHACIAATAAAILAHYFPENSNDWWQKADKLGQSRVLAGVHFPLDIKDGMAQGKKVGQAIVHQES